MDLSPPLARSSRRLFTFYNSRLGVQDVLFSKTMLLSGIWLRCLGLKFSGNLFITVLGQLKLTTQAFHFNETGTSLSWTLHRWLNLAGMSSWQSTVVGVMGISCFSRTFLLLMAPSSRTHFSRALSPHSFCPSPSLRRNQPLWTGWFGIGFSRVGHHSPASMELLLGNGVMLLTILDASTLTPNNTLSMNKSKTPSWCYNMLRAGLVSNPATATLTNAPTLPVACLHLFRSFKSDKVGECSHQ